jgi:hypothetical protein
MNLVGTIRVTLLALTILVGATVGSAVGSGPTQPERPVGPVSFGPLQLIDPAVHYAASNWAGYDVTWLGLNPQQHLRSDISARWTQPNVTCAPGQNSASTIWVGLDGDGDSTLEQTGTSADCVNGQPVYHGWREFYPAASVTYSQPVRPGDAILAQAQFHPQTTNFVVTLTDLTQGWSHVYGGRSPDAQRHSAEIVVEAPTNPSTGRPYPLANFGAVTFTEATLDDTAVMHVGEHFEITMEQPDGSPRAIMTAINPYNGFTIGWRAS